MTEATSVRYGSYTNGNALMSLHCHADRALLGSTRVAEPLKTPIEKVDGGYRGGGSIIPLKSRGTASHRRGVLRMRPLCECARLLYESIRRCVTIDPMLNKNDVIL